MPDEKPKKTASSPQKRQASRPQQSRRPPQKSAALTLLWLMPFISIIILFWMIILQMGIVDPVESFGITMDQWFMLSVFIIICCIIILILSVVGTLIGEAPTAAAAGGGRASGAEREVIIEAVPEEAAAEPDRAAADSEGSDLVGVALTKPKKDLTKTSTEDVKVEVEKDIPPASEAPKKSVIGARMVEYPLKIGGGLYGDTYIKIDKEKVLKLRTLLIEEHYLY